MSFFYFHFETVHSGQALIAQYNSILVLISLLAAFTGAYTALAIIERIRLIKNFSKKIPWYFFGGFSLASGIFAMHFIGMLAFELPIEVHYDLALTLWSFVPALIASFIMLYILSTDYFDNKLLYRFLSGAIIGFGVVLMHYSGMKAMIIDATMIHTPVLTITSVICAPVMATIALNSHFFMSRLRLSKHSLFSIFATPLLMALSISSMHYLAMEGTLFFSSESISSMASNHHIHTDEGVKTSTLNYVISFFLLFNVITSLMMIYQDQRSKNFKQFELKDNKQAFNLFAKFAFLIITASMLLFYSFVNQDMNSEEQQHITLTNNKLENSRIKFDDIFSSALGLAKILSHYSSIQNYLTETSGKNLELLKNDLFIFINNVDIFYQLRLLNEKGDELIRIQKEHKDSTPEISSTMQNKSSRFYFQRINALEQGRIYVSRFDLNMENNEIESPNRPTIRFGFPIFGEDGSRKGMFVLNLRADFLLASLKKYFKEFPHINVFLVDAQGYYLLSPDESKNWGFMFDKPPAFQLDFPNLWTAFNHEVKSQLNTSSQILSFIPLGIKNIDDHFFLMDLQTPFKLLAVIKKERDIVTYIKLQPLQTIADLGFLLILLMASWFFANSIVYRRLSNEKMESLLLELKDMQLSLDEHSIVSTTDVYGRITSINNKFIKISGYDKAELIGKTHTIVKSSEHSQEFYQQLWNTISSGKVWHGEVKNLTKLGAPYWVKATIAPFFDHLGEIYKYVSIRTDITKIKDMEQQLIIAKDVAESGAKAKSEFLANMSHEIRTPMNAIIGLSHLCLQTRLNSRQKDYISKVHSSAAALLKIINDILDFSKIDAGQLDMESIEFSLDELLYNISSMTALKAQEKKLEFIQHIAKGIPLPLVGDPSRLGQVLINLINNAIKFTEQGEVAISVDVKEQGDNFIRLLFTIRDTGIGMTPEQQAKLFQAFSQADTSITRKFGGTGLGLTISKNLIALMDGHIGVESSKGAGSKFIFDARFGFNEKLASKKKTWAHIEELKNIKVLAVDDNDSARQVICDYLESNFHVTTAKDGKDAIVKVQEAEMIGEPYSLVLMDYMMPELDGFSAAKKIRYELGLQKPPLIIMATAYGDEDTVRLALEDAKVDGFLVKPLNQSMLFDGILDAFGYSDGEQQHSYFDDSLHALMKAISGAEILLVEDNEINQQIAQELLQLANVNVVTAQNGLQAVELINNREFDGVLMDLQMPVMDGYEATKNIRKDARFDGLPILAMTANAMLGDKENCIEVGMQDHISKPVEPHDLYNKLARWIKPTNPQPLPTIDIDTISGESIEIENSINIEQTVSQYSEINISELNTELGIKRLLGNKKAYIKILEKFMANQPLAIVKMREALVSEDFVLAERLAHTLKGVADTIGAEKITPLAASLETQLHKASIASDMSDLLNQTDKELQLVCQNISSFLQTHKTQLASELKTTPANSSNEAENISKRNLLLQQMYQQLIDFDGEVDRTLEELLVVINVDEAELIEKLAQDISNYDYETAIEKLVLFSTSVNLQLNANKGEV